MIFSYSNFDLEKLSITIEVHSLAQETLRQKDLATTNVHSLPNPVYKNKHVCFAAPRTIINIELLRLGVLPGK